MSPKLVSADSIAVTRWRNGGGNTREMLAWPDAHAWIARVSVATIDMDGAFSPFPAVVRWFAVLSGAGVRLALPEGEITVREGESPVRFDGAAAPMCQLIAGSTTDLNLMAREDAGVATMSLARAGSRLAGRHRWRGVFTHGSATLHDGAGAIELPARTLAWSDEAQSVTWSLDSCTGTGWWLTLEDR
jgi:environmental stress-induced protein Ves